MKDLATATVATIAMTMFGVPTVLILAGVDRRWLAVVGILAVSPFLVVFYQRLQELQAQGKNRVLMAQAMRLDSGRHTTDSPPNLHRVWDVKPKPQEPKAIPPPWTVSEDSVTEADLRRFVELMFQHGAWSRRATTRWLLPDAGWVSEGLWAVIMGILEDHGVLSAASPGQSRRLLVDTDAQALARLGLPVVERWSGGAVVDVPHKDFTVRVFE